MKIILRKITLWITRKIIHFTHPLSKQGKEKRNKKYHEEVFKD